MFYFIEVVLYKLLIVDIIGQPWLFWAAVAAGLLLFIIREVANADH